MSTTARTRERPIIMQPRNVRAILEGRKTQTRRIIKPQPTGNASSMNHLGREYVYSEGQTDNGLPCPFGHIGDRLWVKERVKYADTFYKGSDREPHHFRARIEYGDGEVVTRDVHMDRWTLACEDDTDKWRSPLFMPRWASRLTLEITDARVESVASISEEDAVAEGCEGWYRPAHPDFGVTDGRTPVEEFAEHWDDINGRGSWAANPWVWALTFKIEETR